MNAFTAFPIQNGTFGLKFGNFHNAWVLETPRPISRLQFANLVVCPWGSLQVFRPKAAGKFYERALQQPDRRTTRFPPANPEQFVSLGCVLTKLSRLNAVTSSRDNQGHGNNLWFRYGGRAPFRGVFCTAGQLREKKNNSIPRTVTAFGRWRRVTNLTIPFRDTLRKKPHGIDSGVGMAAMQQPHVVTPAGGFIYRPFVDFVLQELTSRRHFSSLLVKEEFRTMVAKDSTGRIDNLAFTSPKIRMFRIACIQAGPSTQVLNIAGFSKEEFDLPVFCAEFVSVPNKNIIVLDLNPIHNVNIDKEYKERYYNALMPMANKYVELLPWGDKVTAESLQFFSPLVLWAKAQNDDVTRCLYPAFQDYLLAWLNLVDSACPAIDAVTIARNKEAQQHYLSWRTTKDPGLPLLRKFFGEELAERFVREFLFSGLSSEKSFLDYFPEYKLADGGICKQRSMIGKSYKTRPWNKDGSFSPS